MLNDLLFPATDAGVLAQVVTVAVAGLIALVAARRRPELRLLVVGVWLVIFGVIGLRALH